MLTQSSVDQFRQDGVLHIKGVIEGRELRELQTASDRLLDHAVEHGRTLDEAGSIELRDEHGFWEHYDRMDETRFLYAKDAHGKRVWRRAEDMWNRDPIFRTATVNPRVLAILHSILGPNILPANAAMVTKMPGAGAAVPWHRDPTGKLALEEGRTPLREFVCDIYVDRSTVDNGCVWAIPGSHLGEPSEVEPLDFSRPDARPYEAEPGDVLLHCMSVLHGSPPNTSNSLRRTFYVLFLQPDDFRLGYWPTRKPAEQWIAESTELFESMRRERDSLPAST